MRIFAHWLPCLQPRPITWRNDVKFQGNASRFISVVFSCRFIPSCIACEPRIILTSPLLYLFCIIRRFGFEIPPEIISTSLALYFNSLSRYSFTNGINDIPTWSKYTICPASFWSFLFCFNNPIRVLIFGLFSTNSL